MGPKALCAASTVSAFAVARLDFPAHGPAGALKKAVGHSEETQQHAGRSSRLASDPYPVCTLSRSRPRLPPAAATGYPCAGMHTSHSQAHWVPRHTRGAPLACWSLRNPCCSPCHSHSRRCAVCSQGDTGHILQCPQRHTHASPAPPPPRHR